MSDKTAIRALVVDDTIVNRTVLVSQLQRFGIEAATCTNGAEALEALHAALDDPAPFDLVLMDWHMPEVDGLEALVRHRTYAFELGIEPTPIVMVTADASDDARQRCLEAGAADFLAKPVSLATLRSSLVDVLGEPRMGPDPAAEATAAKADVSLVNRQVIDQMIEDLGGTDAVALVIDAFITDADERLEAVTAGQAGGATTEAQRASHTLKSTAALLGANELSSAARRFESQFDLNERPSDDELAAFTSLFRSTLVELRAMRASFAN